MEKYSVVKASKILNRSLKLEKKKKKRNLEKNIIKLLHFVENKKNNRE